MFAPTVLHHQILTFSTLSLFYLQGAVLKLIAKDSFSFIITCGFILWRTSLDSSLHFLSNSLFCLRFSTLSLCLSTFFVLISVSMNVCPNLGMQTLSADAVTVFMNVSLQGFILVIISTPFCEQAEQEMYIVNHNACCSTSCI